MINMESRSCWLGVTMREKKKMEEAYDKLGLGTKFEYTVVGAPQQNGRVERNLPPYMEE